MYNPHDNPDIAGEGDVMSNGRLVKARLSDMPAPNVSWYWFPIGNCHACKSYRMTPPGCTNAKITPAEFFDKYMVTNTCPEFVAGVDAKTAAADPGRADVLDVMRAVGLAPGKPSQKVVVIIDTAWTPALAVRAHREQGIFLDMAFTADSGKNNPAHGEYVDLEDDLERPTAPPQPAP